MRPQRRLADVAVRVDATGGKCAPVQPDDDDGQGGDDCSRGWLASGRCRPYDRVRRPSAAGRRPDSPPRATAPTDARGTNRVARRHEDAEEREPEAAQSRRAWRSRSTAQGPPTPRTVEPERAREDTLRSLKPDLKRRATTRPRSEIQIEICYDPLASSFHEVPMFTTKARLRVSVTTVIVLACATIAVPQAQTGKSAAAPRVTPPKDQFGFAIGDDYRLVNYTQYTDYLKKLDAQSERMTVVDIGKTEEGPDRVHGDHHLAGEPAEAAADQGGEPPAGAGREPDRRAGAAAGARGQDRWSGSTAACTRPKCSARSS